MGRHDGEIDGDALGKIEGDAVGRRGMQHSVEVGPEHVFAGYGPEKKPDTHAAMEHTPGTEYTGVAVHDNPGVTGA